MSQDYESFPASVSSSPSPEQDDTAAVFKSMLLDFLDDLSNVFHEKRTELLMARVWISARMDGHVLIRDYAQGTRHMWPRIEVHDDALFLDGQLADSFVATLQRQLHLADAAPIMRALEDFRGLWRTLGRREDGNKDVIWQWMDVFVQLARNYEG